MQDSQPVKNVKPSAIADSRQAAINGSIAVKGIPTVDKSRTQSEPVDPIENWDQGELHEVTMFDEEHSL